MQPISSKSSLKSSPAGHFLKDSSVLKCMMEVVSIRLVFVQAGAVAGRRPEAAGQSSARVLGEGRAPQQEGREDQDPLPEQPQTPRVLS